MKKEKENGVIYILTNPSFPEYVKIGYADNVNERLKILNTSPAIPFAFRVYATYEVEHKLEDKKVHKLIDTINPELRSVENINGTKDRLHLIKATENDIKEEQEASEIRDMELNRHHFKDIEFYSSLTNKYYYTKTSSQGTLSIFEKETNTEVPNNSNPSKKQIVLQALKDLGEDVDNGLTLYQLEHRLEKKIYSK